ncbi:hypothetical protein GCM10010517_06770 [Streptosporangium fragile]|uniref:Uncharacterized protein n=1 Tax=Streptosporangium fragile TaxID=46186 RepID=A0ABP6I6F5_9ACTN
MTAGEAAGTPGGNGPCAAREEPGPYRPAPEIRETARAARKGRTPGSPVQDGGRAPA